MGVILCSGFDESLYQKVSVEGAIEADTRFITLCKEDLPLKLGELAEKNEMETPEQNGAQPAKKSEPEPSVLDAEYRYVIFSGSRNQLDNVMRGFRKVYRPVAGSVIYAMLTSTARTWTLEKYLNELGAEHKQMRQYREQQVKINMLHEAPNQEN